MRIASCVPGDWFNVFNSQRAIRLDETFSINSGIPDLAEAFHLTVRQSILRRRNDLPVPVVAAIRCEVPVLTGCYIRVDFHGSRLKFDREGRPQMRSLPFVFL